MQEAPAWELSKENAAPLERGRNVATFEQNLRPSEERDDMVRQFERLVRAQHHEDPLVHWLSYIKYFQDNFPSDTHGQFLLLERCTRALVGTERYCNDVRFIRVCVLYADKTQNPHDVFKYLHQSKVGSETTLFWIAWAWVAEKNGEFAFAEKIFKKAKANNAEPKRQLKQRYAQFQRRMSRHWLNSSEAAEQETSESRGVLGQLSQESLRRNDRRLDENSFQQRQQQRNPSLSTFSVRGSSLRRREVRLPQNNNKSGFAIFHDEQCVDQCQYDLDKSREEPRVAGEWPREAEQTKENTMQAHKWNQHGGLSTANSTASLHFHRRTGSSGQSGFAIHVDDECAAQHVEEDRQRKIFDGPKDDRTLRQRVDGGLADRLVREPLRYVQHPSKLESDQVESELTERTKKSNEKTKNDGKVSCGFNKRLLSRDTNGMEQCFEEGRSSLGCFKIAGNEGNFNHLFVVEQNDDALTVLDSTNGSTMDESLEDVEMEDGCQNRLSLPSSTTSQAAPRKALFRSKSSLGSGSNNGSFYGHNASTASSTLNETDAVGVAAGREEETINTKLAMKELSMMFSSPAMGLTGIYEGTPNPPQAEGRTVNSFDGNDHHNTGENASDSFCEYRDENQAPRNPEARTNATVGFEQCVLRPLGSSEIEQGPRQVFAEQALDSQASPVATADIDEYDEHISHSQPEAAVASFEIYCDDDQIDKENSIPPLPTPEDESSGKACIKREAKVDFSIFEDEPIPAAADGHNKGNLSKEDAGRENGFRDSKHHGRGTVLLNTTYFGDISHIEDEGEDLTSSPKKKFLLSSPESSSEQVLDYHSLHKKDVLGAVECVRSMAQQPIKHRNVYHIPGKSIPPGLFRKKGLATKGTEVVIGEQEGIVKQELGRGSYGVVVLLDSDDSFVKGHDDTVAVKAQKPIDCLAWEYLILTRIEDRVREYWDNTVDAAPFPFPRALSFASLADGGLLSMNAGSKSGLNLVDIANIYKVNERGPVPELVVFHYTARMLQHLETLHCHGKIIHCDVKPDNWVLTASSDAFIGCTECVEGSDLMLVDFGRAVDLEIAAKDGMDPQKVKLFGNASAEDMTCASMLNNLPWRFEIDTYGVCASSHVLLYGSHMEIEFDKSTQRYKIRKPFRRYWNRELWTEVFDTLLNVSASSHNLCRLRESIESFIHSDSKKQKQLEALLRHQARILPDKRLSPKKS